MAITEHPITGVQLNEIRVKRRALSHAEAVTAHIMRCEGHTFTDIVQRLGTNANRVGEVFKGQTHPGSAMDALALLTAK